jgi:hypothetical protein
MPCSSTSSEASAGCVSAFFADSRAVFSNIVRSKQHGDSVILTKFDGEVFLKAIEKQKAEVLHLVPPIVLFLTQTDLTNSAPSWLPFPRR